MLCNTQRKTTDHMSAPLQSMQFGIYYTYMPKLNRETRAHETPRKAKIFMNNRSQAVRLPKEFQFNVREVFIRKEGPDVVLSARPFDWSTYLSQEPAASETFMEGIEDLPVQDREP